MKKIKIVCVGDLKEDYLKKAQTEYIKRLHSALDVEIIEVPEYTVINHNSQAEIEIKKQKEGKAILNKISGYSIAMCINAKQYTSVDFASNLDAKFKDNSTVTFIIGGSDGLSSEVEQNCNQKISFSSLTFPHQLMRIILLEQIYRSYTIWSGKTYHK